MGPTHGRGGHKTCSRGPQPSTAGHTATPSQGRKGLAVPRRQGRSWGCVEAEREGAGGKAGGQAGGGGRIHHRPCQERIQPPKRNTAPEEGQQRAPFHQQCGASAPPPRQPRSAHKGPLCPCRSRAGRELGPGADGRGQSPGGRGAKHAGSAGGSGGQKNRDRWWGERIGGQRQGDWQRTGRRVKVRGQSIMGSRDWGDWAQRPRAPSPARRLEGLRDTRTLRRVPGTGTWGEKAGGPAAGRESEEEAGGRVRPGLPSAPAPSPGPRSGRKRREGGPGPGAPPPMGWSSYGLSWEVRPSQSWGPPLDSGATSTSTLRPAPEGTGPGPSQATKLSYPQAS